MYDIKESYRNVRLVLPEDEDYVGFMRRMADSRPSRGGPRSAGEYLGGIVELCVRHWLSQRVSLQDERILAWDQRLRNGRIGPMYRELDAVWQIDEVSLCLFEMKLTYAENMQHGVGIRQLNIAAETLFTDSRWQYILKRLVYVATERVSVLDGIPELAPDDEYAEIGVIWVLPEEVEAAAIELGVELPDNWREPESREGFIENPERDEWKQYVDGGKALASESSEDSEADTTEDSPLALALKRAIQGNGTGN